MNNILENLYSLPEEIWLGIIIVLLTQFAGRSVKNQFFADNGNIMALIAGLIGLSSGFVAVLLPVDISLTTAIVTVVVSTQLYDVLFKYVFDFLRKKMGIPIPE